MPEPASARSSAHEDSASVLWITDEAMDPALGGGSIRQAHLFGALATAVPTDLLIVGQTPDRAIGDLAQTITVLPRDNVPWTEHPIGRRAISLGVTLASPYPSAMYPLRPVRRALSRAIAQRGRGYSVVCVEHEGLAPLIPISRAERWIVTFHYLLSGMIERELALAPGARQRWFRQRDLTKAQAVERRAVSSYDRCVVCSEQDAAALRSIGGDTPSDRIQVVPNGVDLGRVKPTPVPGVPRVLFPGRLDWPPNIDGARWFCGEVWPRVQAEVPDAELMLVGRSPGADVLALGELPGVSVHADVPSMAPFLESARVVLVPLRVGTGTRLKALEGLAAGRPVVGTSVGLEGIGIVDGVHALVADGTEAFSRAVITALRDDALATSLVDAGRAHVEAGFGWDRIGEQFVALVFELLAPAEPDRVRHGVERA
jgi:glycosyltransferase involved in cell wall biosynthesis